MPELQDNDNAPGITRPEYTDEDRRREALFIISTVHEGVATPVRELIAQAERISVYIETGVYQYDD